MSNIDTRPWWRGPGGWVAAAAMLIAAVAAGAVFTTSASALLAELKPGEVFSESIEPFSVEATIRYSWDGSGFVPSVE